jgi:nickel-dependent lactate racemase
MHATVIYISSMPKETIEKMHMIPADSIENALTIAKQILDKNEPKIVAIPDGVSVIVKKG